MRREQSVAGLAALSILLLCGTCMTAQPPRPTSDLLTSGDYQQLNRLIKDRYDGQTLVVNVAGLLAGEYQKRELNVGSGEMGMIYYHFHPDRSIPKAIAPPDKVLGKKATSLNQLDERTFSQLAGGLNITRLEKGERVRVNKFYMRKDYVDLYLEPLDPIHLQDLDVNKASRRVTSMGSLNGPTAIRVAVAGFGLRFIFYFDRALLDSGNAAAVASEISRYLAPR